VKCLPAYRLDSGSFTRALKKDTVHWGTSKDLNQKELQKRSELSASTGEWSVKDFEDKHNHALVLVVAVLQCYYMIYLLLKLNVLAKNSTYLGYCTWYLFAVKH
jgi:hypothetical protein